MVKFQYVVLSVIYIGLIIGITYFLIAGINKTPEVAQSYIQPGQAEKLEIEERERTIADLMPVEVPINITTPQIATQERKFYPPPTYNITFVKGLTFNPRFDFDAATDISKAKELGTNLIVIELELEQTVYTYPNIYTTQGFDDWKPRTIQIINEAHKAGLPVELRTVSRAGTDLRIGPYTDNETSAYLNNSVTLFKTLADFADEYKTARFTLYAEIDNQYNWGNRLDDINKVLRDLLDAVKPRYSGKIGIGFTSRTFVDRGISYDTSGFDYVALSIYPDDISQELGFSRFGAYSNRIYETVKIAKPQAKQHAIDEVILGSIGVNTDSGAPVPFRVTVSQQDESEMYEKIFNTHSNTTNGYTIAYDTFMYSVKGEPAEQVVAKWYKSLPD